MKILDLFCCEGGASMGLAQRFPDAEITGVDIDPQPRYPHRFVQADAMTYPLDGFDLVWASPPCQGYSVMRHLPWNRDKVYPLLIAPTLARLRAWASEGPERYFIIENVEGARKELPNALWLCGTMFGKRFYRHRLFETNFAWFQPLHPKHTVVMAQGDKRPSHLGNSLTRASGLEPWLETAKVKTRIELKRGGLAARQQAAADNGFALSVGHSGKRSSTMVVDDHAPKSMIEAARAEMECPWMSAHGLSQAIPPVFSHYIAQFIPVVAA